MSSPKTFQEAEVGLPCHPNERILLINSSLPKSIYDRATKLEYAAEFSSAFQLYLEATDAFLHLSRSSAATPAFQAQCRAKAAKALQRAEKIKRASKTLGVVTAPVNSFGPGECLRDSMLSSFTYHGADHQAYVLRKSSTVNNTRYPVWNEPVPLPSNPGTPYSYVQFILGRCHPTLPTGS